MSESASNDDPTLAPAELALLDRVRHLRQLSGPSPAAHARVLQRLSEDEGGSCPEVSLPTIADLLPAGSARGAPWARGATWPLAGVAVVCLGLASLPSLQRTEWGRALFGDESSDGSGDGAPADLRGIEGLPLFRSAAQALPADAEPSSAGSLFSVAPFSRQSRAWQVKHWEDLRAPPTLDASSDFEPDGALCITLGRGERVLAAWPWRSDEPPSTSPGGDASGDDREPPVSVSRGVAYRLRFDAWMEMESSARLFVALGHADVPHAAAAGARVPLSTERRPFVVDFVPESDDSALGMALLARTALGSEGARVCVGDVMLERR